MNFLTISNNIEQRIYVPEDATTVSFDCYGVCQQPVMLSLNKDYEDGLEFELANDDDGAINGTGYYSWHDSINVHNYQGQYLTLRFHVSNYNTSGDSRRTLIIDNIRINGTPSNNADEGKNNQDDTREYLTWPTDSTQITLHNGQIDDVSKDKHIGIDIQGTQGNEVYAAVDGEVVFAGQKEGYGNLVIINSEYEGKNIQTRYAHLNSLSVETGDYVFAGDTLGEIGTTGNVIGNPVLHFEMLQSTDENECLVDGSNAINVDPEDYLFPFIEIEGVDDLNYLSEPFSFGIVPDDCLETMGATTTNKGLQSGYVYLNTLKKRYGSRINYHINNNIITLTLAGHKKTGKFGANYKMYNNAKKIDGNWAIKISDFLKYFYPQTFSTVKYPNEVIDIKNSLGKFNPYIYKIQCKLNVLMYTKGVSFKKLNTNGICDNNTLKAVNDFKEIKGLPNSGKNEGIIDCNTWNILFNWASKYNITDKGFQITKITSNSISFYVSNPKGKRIEIYNKLLGAANKRKRIKTYTFTSDNGNCTIGGLFERSIDYEVAVFDSNGKRIILEKYIIINPLGMNPMSSTQYENYYIKNAPNKAPTSWGLTHKNRAKVENVVLPPIIISFGLKDIDKDGINDMNDIQTYTTSVNVRSYSFNSLGFTVYECPFKPGYFSGDVQGALKGETQCFEEYGSNKKYYTLQDLDNLDYNHRWDVIGEGAYKASKVTICAAADTVTVCTLYTGVAEAQGAKGVLLSILRGISPFNKFTISVDTTTTAEDFLVKGIVPKDDLGTWAKDSLIPFCGTYDSIKDIFTVDAHVSGVFLDIN